MTTALPSYALVLLSAAAVSGPVGLAAAQERPRVLPSRDVSAVYALDGAASRAIPGGAPGSVTLRWNAGEQRLRIEAEGRSQVLLVDLRGHSAVILEQTFRTAMRLPFSERSAQRLRLDGARFTRQGQDTVAGLGCTVYAVQHPQGRGTMCLTADGVPLRADGQVDGRQGGFLAQAVDYAKQPAALFRAPDGYARLDLGMGR